MFLKGLKQKEILSSELQCLLIESSQTCAKQQKPTSSWFFEEFFLAKTFHVLSNQIFLLNKNKVFIEFLEKKLFLL